MDLTASNWSGEDITVTGGITLITFLFLLIISVFLVDSVEQAVGLTSIYAIIIFSGAIIAMYHVLTVVIRTNSWLVPTPLSRLILAPLLAITILIALPKYTENTIHVYSRIFYKKAFDDSSIEVISIKSHNNTLIIELLSNRRHGFIVEELDDVGATMDGSYFKENTSDKFNSCKFCGETPAKYRLSVYNKPHSNTAHSRAVCSTCSTTIQKEVTEYIIEQKGEANILSTTI